MALMWLRRLAAARSAHPATLLCLLLLASASTIANAGSDFEGRGVDVEAGHKGRDDEKLPKEKPVKGNGEDGEGEDGGEGENGGHGGEGKQDRSAASDGRRWTMTCSTACGHSASF